MKSSSGYFLQNVELDAYPPAPPNSWNAVLSVHLWISVIVPFSYSFRVWDVNRARSLPATGYHPLVVFLHPVHSSVRSLFMKTLLELSQFGSVVSWWDSDWHANSFRV